MDAQHGPLVLPKIKRGRGLANCLRRPGQLAGGGGLAPPASRPLDAVQQPHARQQRVQRRAPEALLSQPAQNSGNAFRKSLLARYCDRFF
jgi:hypothetical protein